MRYGPCGIAFLVASSICVSASSGGSPGDLFDIRTVSDRNHDGVVDGADVGLMLLGEEEMPSEPGLESQLELPQASLSTSGVRGLSGSTYVVTVDGIAYSVMDVYIKFGSAVGSGTAAERVVAVFGQSTTDASTGNVNKSARYENSAALPFQHLNTSWLPGNANGSSGWDSFLTIGCRTQGAGNSANVTADPFFLNPSSATAAGVATVSGGSDQLTPPRFVGAGVYQAAPLDAGWETNVGTFADRKILIGRFALKVSDIVATGGSVTMKVWTNFTGKSTAQSGGTTLYTLSAANLKSDASTTYTGSGQTWTFVSEFEGTDVNQQPWTFATSTLLVPSQYSTIQAAINAAPSSGGWTVAVAPGVYNEAIDLKGKAITVKATGSRATTIIDGTGLTTSVVRAVTGETSATVLEGFTIRKGPIGSAVDTYRLGGGMYIANASPTLRNCSFADNLAGYGGGLYARYSNSLVANCVFQGNRVSSDGGGLQFFGGSPVIRDCVVTDNVCTNRGGGMHLVQHTTGGFALVQNCTITGNVATVSEGGGVSIYPSVAIPALMVLDGCSITGNRSQGRGAGVYAPWNVAAAGPEVSLVNNTICSNTSDTSKRENTWLLFEDLGNTICDCFSDVDGNGSVNTGDLGFALLFVGEATDPDFIQADQDMNGFVDTGDIALLLLNFGPCS